MFTECEHKCLQKIARECKLHGLTLAETEQKLHQELGAISTMFRIRQAARQVFADPNQ